MQLVTMPYLLYAFVEKKSYKCKYMFGFFAIEILINIVIFKNFNIYTRKKCFVQGRSENAIVKNSTFHWKGFFLFASVILLKHVFDLYAKNIFFPIEISIYKVKQVSRVIQ